VVGIVGGDSSTVTFHGVEVMCQGVAGFWFMYHYVNVGSQGAGRGVGVGSSD